MLKSAVLCFTVIKWKELKPHLLSHYVLCSLKNLGGSLKSHNVADLTIAFVFKFNQRMLQSCCQNRIGSFSQSTQSGELSSHLVGSLCLTSHFMFMFHCGIKLLMLDRSPRCMNVLLKNWLSETIQFQPHEIQNYLSFSLSVRTSFYSYQVIS